MHHFVAEMSQVDIGSVTGFVRKAEAIYDENLNAYVKIVLRRPFSKIIVSAICTFCYPYSYLPYSGFL